MNDIPSGLDHSNFLIDFQQIDIEKTGSCLCILFDLFRFCSEYIVRINFQDWREVYWNNKCNRFCQMKQYNIMVTFLEVNEG